MIFLTFRIGTSELIRSQSRASKSIINFDHLCNSYSDECNKGRKIVSDKFSNEKTSQKNDEKISKKKEDIRCAVCGHKLINTNDEKNFLNDLKSPYSKNTHILNMFGQENITIQEFVNPHDFHFHSIHVSNASKLRFRRFSLPAKTFSELVVEFRITKKDR